jgi:hypothetical protein
MARCYSCDVTLATDFIHFHACCDSNTIVHKTLCFSSVLTCYYLALLTQHSSSVGIELTASNLFSFTLHESMTNTQSSIVMLVSAMFVATTILRTPSGGT